jgi:arginine/lysine/ornithine decarboxylase
VTDKVAAHPLLVGADARLRMAVVTNSTYDGTMYRTPRRPAPPGRRAGRAFDEAWIPYAAFHSVYRDHFAMSPRPRGPGTPTVFATMSTHKMLASFSQGSMIHLKEGRVPIDARRFNEAFMMHASTSPQYEIVASLDVATRMMGGAAGHTLMAKCLREAVVFRQELNRLVGSFSGRGEWFFRCWQREDLRLPGAAGYAMLDPAKVLKLWMTSRTRPSEVCTRRAITGTVLYPAEANMTRARRYRTTLALPLPSPLRTIRWSFRTSSSVSRRTLTGSAMKPSITGPLSQVVDHPGVPEWSGH